MADFMNQPGSSYAAGVQGTVYLYVSDLNPSTLNVANMIPMAYIKIKLEKSVTPILKALARKYKPLSSEYLILNLIRISILYNFKHLKSGSI
jgi:hypothetical protein